LRDDPRLARDLATGLRARVAWRGGHPDQALRMLEGMPITAFIGPPSGWRTRTHERELRAELLRAVGRDAEALRWYEVLYDPDMFGLPYLAPSYLRRAEIEEKLGRTDQAMLHYRRVLDLWSECDPELRSIVGEARERLARLTSVRS
jgi:tetratricopeptide (TPR) repeat protein